MILSFPKKGLYLILGLAVLSCREDTTSTPNPSQTANVTIVYQAPTAMDPSIEDRFPACVRAVGSTHLHPSWRNFNFVNLMAQGVDRWEFEFTDVPVNQLFRINDPNECDSDPNGAVTTNIFANGVRLTNIVGTPGNGTEPGLSFIVNSSGIIIP